MDAKDKFNCKHCMIFHKYSGKEKSPKIPSMESQIEGEQQSPRSQRRQRMFLSHQKKSVSMDTINI